MPSKDRAVQTDFIPALDGLRGIAILGVLLFHLELPKCSLGWAGVELFFVISGFLITRILLKTRTQPNYFKNFYCRRALRIFPIYYLVILAYAVPTLVLSHNYKTLALYCVYLQTISQLRSQFLDLPMLGHSWTLAIEEQFYLVWPLAVFLLRGRKLLFASVVLIIAGPALRLLSLHAANPFLVDGWIGVQVDALAAGAMVAFVFSVLDRKSIQRWTTAAFLVGLGILIVLIKIGGLSAFWTPREWGRMWYAPILLSAMACMFAGAVGMAAAGHRWAVWLKIRPLMQWGKISYGIYLFHPFAFLLVDTLLRHMGVVSRGHLVLRLLIALIKLTSAYAVAWVSWHLIEARINRLKARFSSDRAIAERHLEALGGPVEQVRALA